MKTITSLMVVAVMSMTSVLAGAATPDNGLSRAAADAFVKAPVSVIPFIPEIKRMDMIDYFNSGMDRSIDNMLGGKTRILELTPDKISVEEVADRQAVTTLSLDKWGRDTVYIVTSNIATPAVDGMVKFYLSPWKELDRKSIFQAPEVAEWVKNNSKTQLADIENAIPFVMASYSYDPATHILTLTPSFKDYVPAADYEKIKDSLLPQLRYKWSSGKMKKLK